MGLFDRVWGAADKNVLTKLSKEEAIAGIAMCACNADGNMSSEEVVRAAHTLLWLRIYQRCDPRQIESILNKMIDLTKRRGPGTILQGAKEVLDQNESAAAFFIAADLVLADGIVEEREKMYMYELQKALNLDDALAEKIIEVAVIKNSV